MALFNTTCKQATYLLSKQEEGQLSWKEKLQLKSHLAICIVCRFFDIQSRHIGEAAKDVSTDEELPPQAKQRIQQQLDAQMGEAE